MSFQFPCCPCAGALCAKHTRNTRNTKRQSPCAILARDPSPYVRKPRNLSTKRNHNSWIAHPHPRDVRAHSHAYARTRPRLRPALRRNARAIYTTNTSRARETPSARTRDADAREIAISPARSSANPSASVGPSPSVRALATTRTRDRARESKRRNVLCVMHLRRRRAVALHGRGAVVCDARARRPIAPRLGGVRRTCAFVAFAACHRKTLCVDGCAFHRSMPRSTSPRVAFFACTSSRGAD